MSGPMRARNADTSSTCFWACSLRSQKPGSAMSDSSSLKRACLPGKSKIPPQTAHAGFEFVGAEGVGIVGHDG